MRILRRDVPEGARAPRGYAFAWWDFATLYAAAYPFGLHLIVGWARRGYLWLASRPGLATHDIGIVLARQAGYEDGALHAAHRARRARLAGFDAGFEVGREAVMMIAEGEAREVALAWVTVQRAEQERKP